MVKFEYLTLLPPNMHKISGDGFPNGAGLPLPVTNAVPVTTNPSVMAGLNTGQTVIQSVLITPSVIPICRGCAPRVPAGPSFFTRPPHIPSPAPPTSLPPPHPP